MVNPLLRFVLVLLSILNPSFGSVALGSEEPFLESVDGMDYVRLERGGVSYEIYPGEFLEVGDLLDVGKGGCRIVVPGLAEVSVSENTKVQWLGSATGAPEFNVSEGMIWARVVKYDLPPTPVAAPDAVVPERYKFTVRTRAAVLGVRGTEFTAEYRNDASVFSTFEGEVSVAKDSTTLWSGRGLEKLHPEDRMIWGYDRAPNRDRFKLDEMRAQLKKTHPRAFRLRHQNRLTVNELRSFQKNLKRVNAGQNIRGKRTLRSVLDLNEEQAEQIDRRNWRNVSPAKKPEEKKDVSENRKEIREERKKMRQERRVERGQNLQALPPMHRAPHPKRTR